MKSETLTVGKNPLPGLRYDGKFGDFHFQFTEYDETAPSYRTTFVVEALGFTLEKLAAKRAFKVEQFSRCALL